MALPPKHRLSDRLTIQRVFKNGKIINSNPFLIRFYRSNLNFSRFMIIVSSKISKKSVIRNKIKRRLNEIIRLDILDVLKNKPGYDLIVVVKPEALDQGYDELKESLIKQVNRIK